ncbi:hypothetical protein SAMN05443247_05682 [Bradyrhizobium erythrophlei]|nr:hypothetical protein SAMN05443247_05682 [Bradyrhizobium erythrophlei]
MVKHGWSASPIAGLSQSAALQRESKMIDKAFDPVRTLPDQILSRQAQRQMRPPLYGIQILRHCLKGPAQSL